MRKNFITATGAFMLLAGGALALAQITSSTPEGDADDEQVVTLDQVPAAVRETILSHTDASSIVTIEIDRETGSDVYDVEVTGGSEFMVAPDGAYLGVENDDNDEG